MQNSKIINCLDIGSYKITAISGQFFSSENKINIIGIASTPTLGLKRGQVIDLETAASSISQVKSAVERMTGSHFDKAHVCLTGTHFQSTSNFGTVATSNPRGEINQTDIQRAIEASKAITLEQGREVIHTIPRRFTIDGQEGIVDPMGMNGVRLQVETTIVTASSATLKNLNKCIQLAGINILTLTYNGLAEIYSALTLTDKELGAIIIDIGGSHTSVTVVTENNLNRICVLPLGGSNITNDLAIGLRISLDQAEKLKLSLSRNEQNKKFIEEIDIDSIKINAQTAINGIIKPRLEEIFMLINEYLEENNIKPQTPSGVVLSGGGSLTIQAQSIASKVLNLPVRIAEIKDFGGLVDDILNPSYASALGLVKLQTSHDTEKLKETQNSHLPALISNLFKNLFKKFLP